MKNNPQTGNADIWTFDLATGNGTPDHQRHAAGQCAGLVAGQQAGGLRVDPRELLRHLPKSGGRNGRGGTVVPLHTRRRDGPHRLVGRRKVLDLLHARAPGGAARPQSRSRWIGKRSSGSRKTTTWSRAGFLPTRVSSRTCRTKPRSTIMQVYVRPFDASKPESPGPVRRCRFHKNGAVGMIFWRQDGKELYFMTRDWEVMAVDITTTPTFQAGTPRLLFKLPGPLPGSPSQGRTSARMASNSSSRCRPLGQLPLADARRDGTRAKATQRPIALRSSAEVRLPEGGWCGVRCCGALPPPKGSTTPRLVVAAALW